MMRTQNHHHHHNHDHDHDHQQQQSRVLYDLSSLVLNILRHPPSPSTLNFSDFISPPPPPPPALRSPRLARVPPSAPPQQITAGGFASLMLGISLALMLCGSVTFFIGFMLLPWVIGLVMVFYFVGLVTSISVLGRALLCYATSSSSSSSPPRKDFPGWKFL